MAFDAFIYIDGIEGESTDDKHQGWSEILSFGCGHSQTVSRTASSAGGAGAERADFRNFQFENFSIKPRRSWRLRAPQECISTESPSSFPEPEQKRSNTWKLPCLIVLSATIPFSATVKTHFPSSRLVSTMEKYNGSIHNKGVKEALPLEI